MKARRQAILGTLARVGREHSDATVLFHARLATFLGLHPTDYKTLSVLARLGAMSAGDISRHAGLATASVTNLIDRLTRKGFVRRIADIGDRRRVLVEARMERLNAARRQVESPVRSLAQLFGRYSDAELVVIADFLGRNAERLRNETVKLRSISVRQARAVGGRERSARQKRKPDATVTGKAARIAVENINHPGKSRLVDAAKYRTMRQALLKTLPTRTPGRTIEDVSDDVLPHLPATLFPGGTHAGWWLKTVQLDLEAKGLIAREKTTPLRLHRR